MKTAIGWLPGLAAVCFSALVWAQADPAPPLTTAELQTRLRHAQSETELDGKLKQDVIETYEAAIERFEIATEAAAIAASFQEKLRTVGDEFARAQQKLAELPDDATPAIAPDQDLVSLQRTLEERRRQIEDPDHGLRKRLADANRVLSGRKPRLEEIARNLAEIEVRLASIQELVDAPVPPDEPRELTNANQTLYRVRQMRANEERAALRAEQAWCESDEVTELLRTLRDTASRELALADSEVKALQRAVDERRGSEADQRLRAAQRIAAQVPAWLKPVAEKNVQLASECRDLANNLRTTIESLDRARTTFGTLKSEFEQSRKMVEAIGLTESIGLLLRQQRSKLRDTRDLHARLASRGDSVRATRMRLFQIETELGLLQDLEAAAARTARELQEETSPDQTARVLESDLELIAGEIRPLLEQRVELLEQLDSDSESHFEKLVLLDNDERKVLDETNRYSDFIDERVLWIRTGAVFGSTQALRATREASWLFDGTNWNRIVDALRTNVQQETLPYALALAGLVVWFCTRWTLLKRLRSQGLLAADEQCHSLLPTLQATLLTVLLAALIPSIFLFFSWRLDNCATNSRFVHAFAVGLTRAARFLIPLHLLRYLVQRDGLAERHFGWRPETVRRLRRHLYWFVPVGVVLVTIVGMVETTPDEVRLDTLGRSAYLLFVAALTLFSFRAFTRPVATIEGETVASDPRRPTPSRNDPEQWRQWMIRVGLRVAVAIPVGLLLLAWSGYFYTALQLTWRLMATGWLLVGLTLVRGLVLRWITLERRRMAVLQNQELQDIEGKQSGSEPHAPFLFPRWTWPDFRLNLSQIVTQVRSLLDTGLLTVAAVGLWLIWADVTPALNILDQIPLWQTTVSEVVPVNDGATSEVRIIQRPKAITAANLGLGLLLLFIAAIASRNVPGLVEVILLEHLSVDAGIRFATTCLVRYFLFITGVILAFNQIGVGWNSVQWLVAAASVGLGFGLQEIFANFVSGIILLFERPMRVGDVITIGDTTGTVSRIRFRATTIVDGDRKELIVPNKAFITGNLLNWTLSDSINRVTIRVGVAYGADPNQVRELLLKIAGEHPLLLKEPAPQAFLEGFGENSLNFQLCAFLPTLKDRQRTMHELNTFIHTRFRAAGIDIPYPHRDVTLTIKGAEEGDGDLDEALRRSGLHV